MVGEMEKKTAWHVILTNYETKTCGLIPNRGYNWKHELLELRFKFVGELVYFKWALFVMIASVLADCIRE